MVRSARRNGHCSSKRAAISGCGAIRLSPCSTDWPCRPERPVTGASRWRIARIGALTAAALAVNTALVMLPLLGVPGDWQLDDTTLAALTILSVAAGAETATWLAFGEAATLSHGGFELTWINWTQGVGLLLVIQAAL